MYMRAETEVRKVRIAFFVAPQILYLDTKVQKKYNSSRGEGCIFFA